MRGRARNASPGRSGRASRLTSGGVALPPGGGGPPGGGAPPLKSGSERRGSAPLAVQRSTSPLMNFSTLAWASSSKYWTGGLFMK